MASKTEDRTRFGYNINKIILQMSMAKQIYTDWANHYLEKARNKRYISDLQQDVSDGVLLADVIEAVTNEKILDIKTKPKNSAQMVENINTCLTFLANLGVNVEGLNAKDIKDGNLKSILSLFFNLSRYKQQQKSQQQHKDQHQRPHLVEATNTNQTNGDDVQSRLPSYKQQNSKCLISAHSGTSIKDGSNSTTGCSKSSSGGNTSGSGSKGRSQLSAQNNNLPSTAGADPETTTSSRATSPACSGIPTPGGRGLTSRSQEKQQSRTTQSQSSNSSIPTPSKSSSPKSGSSFASGSANKNSMLDKFKLFNSKDKGKSKGGSSKGLSKASSSASSASAPSTSSRSDTDSKSSTSLQSSSSTDPGASLSPQDGEPPKLPAKTKSSAFTGPKRENSGLTVPLEPTIRQGSPSFGVSSSATGSLSSTKKSLSAKSQKNDYKAAPVDAKSAAQSSSSTQSLTRPPKVGSLIPKTSLRTSKSSSSSSLSSQGALGSGIPTPTSSIPKPATAKVSKPSKEEKMKAISTAAKEQDRNGNNMQSIQNQTIPVTKKSSKSMQGMAQQQQAQQVILQQQQQMAHLQQQQHPPPVPPHRNNGNKAAQFTSCSDHSISQTRSQTPQEQLSRLQDGRSTFPKTRYTEIEYSDGKIERVGEGHLSKSSQAAALSQVMDLHGTTIPQKVSASHPAYHLVTTASQSVNVVKPTCSTAYNPVMKADGNTQTALTVLHRGSRPPPLPTTEPPPSRHKKLESPKECKAQSDANTSETATHFANSSSSGNNSASSSETEAAKTGTEEKSEPAEVSSPRLGVKALVPQIGRPANNVAIVQPRHGEKIETTFDTEVRTEMINKGNVSKDGKQGKETTFSEKKATFVDDSGETMDIQPMAPIMRATPYGYYRSISSQSSNAKHYQTPVVTLPSGTYALATTAGSRLGMSRTIVDQGRFYSGPIKRAMSSGSGSVPFDTDYSSDYDTYDYISGYMSDGDILKRNNMDDMTSGYMSEGGASMYARRLQQRFREGMQAVKECMQKSRGLIDDDSFDDSSSISSGDISDTINEISTDEGNLTGGSSQSDTNPYASLKHGPRDLFRNLTNENLHGVLPGKRVPNLGTSAFMGTDYASDSGGGYGGSASGWRKYSLQNNRLLSSDPADYAYLYNGYDSMQWRNQDGSRPLRKLSNASQPEIHYRSASTNGDYAGEHVSDSNSLKRDSETNTDQSHLYEASLRKLHSIQSPRLQSGGSVGYGYRRPLSNVSTSSVGSNRSSGGSKGSSSVGTRLAMYSNTTSKLGSEHNGVLSHAGTAQNVASNKESGPDAYVSASLERNKKGGNPVSKSSSSAQTDADMYKSNSLGRRKGIGVKAPLMKTAAGENGNICGSTIISNPHATFSKGDPRGQPNPYSSVNIPGISGSSSTGNYVSLEYVRGMGPAWLRTSGGNISNYGVHSPYGHLSDSETIDGLSAYASSIQAQIQQARALSGASARILAQQRGEYGQSGGLQRSNSMRSTQSDSVYASFQHCHTDDLAMTNSYSQLPSPPPPSSPTPSNSSHASSRFTFPMTTYNSSTAAAINPSPSQNMVRSNTSNSLPYGNMGLAKLSKEDEESLHGSSLSLVSSSSSVYSTAEEKQNHEIRKLKRDLEAAQEKVSTLTTQLSTNAHVVAAFEQSLSNMTSRLQHLTATAEQKDTELNDLRATIEALKRQSGLSIPDPMLNANVGRRHTTPGMVGKDLVQGGRPQFHTLPMPNEARITRQISSDSMSSINSMSSACSMTSQQSAATDGDLCKKKKKKGWLRSSFSKAFSGKKKNKNGSLSDVEPDTTSLRSTLSVPNSPLLQVHMQNGSGLIKGSHSSGALCEGDDTITVSELKKLLRDKDMKLTDIRLEALSSAHQLEQLRETMNKMKTEMGALKADNDRLQKLICSKGLNTSQNSLVQHSRSSSDSLERTVSLTEQTSLDLLLHETNDREGRRVTITVYLGSNPDPIRTKKPPEVLIGSLSVSGKTKWDILDNINRKIFKEYVLRIDPVTNLGLSSESVFSYHIGEIVRTKDSEPPELLPIGYLVGDTMQIGICLKGTKQNSVDSLAFETLIPKSIIQRYISLLMEHRRIILCGPSGTGKTYLAQKLAEHLVLRSGKELTAGSVATFNVDHKSAKELRSYLANIADQCENTSVGELPSVIILDNLHHVSSLGEVFNGFLSVKYQKCPYIIGTMNQATCSTTNLQLHHNFRWVLCANHMEPVKGFLGRFLRRKLVEAEVMTSMRNNDLNNIIDWVPKVWMHINKLLETHSSSDVTIGPRLFLSCPMDIAASKLWFTDLWNYSIVPYMIEAVREGLQVYGRRAPWEDPSEWVRETYPWSLGKDEEQILLRIRPEDVGYDTVGVLSSDNSSPKIKNKGDTTTDSEGDPMVSDV